MNKTAFNYTNLLKSPSNLQKESVKDYQLLKSLTECQLLTPFKHTFLKSEPSQLTYNKQESPHA